MPKKVAELSPVQIRRLTKPGFHSVGGVSGLMLKVNPSGGRSWVLRIQVAGKRRDIGLGGYPTITLAQAREKARDTREKISQGIDPIEERKAAKGALEAQRRRGITFDECAAKVVAIKQKEASNLKHGAQWETTLAKYASPVLGELPVCEIELAHIVKVLEPYWSTKTETMTRVRQRIEAVMAWATAHGFREGQNPAAWKGNLDAVLPKPSKITKVSHHRAMPIAEVGDFMRQLRQAHGMAARCLEFVILTAARSGEARGAQWDEIDLAAKIWTVPAERMKAGRAHRVPLSTDALALLKDLPRHEGTSLVFPGPRGAGLSENAMTMLLKRMNVEATAHGFRSTFRDWASEFTGYPHEVCEMALAHTIKNAAEAAYRRGDLLDKRHRLMQDWAKFCAQPLPQGEVVPLNRHNS